MNFPLVKDYLTDVYKFDKFIYLLALTTKLRNAQTVSVLGMCKGKQYEELQARMGKDQENYEEIERDIAELMDGEVMTKKIKEEYALIVGKDGKVEEDRIIRL